MTPAELRRHLELLFGESWQRPACEWLGVSVRTIQRQTSGEQDVDGPVAAAVRERLRWHAKLRGDLERTVKYRTKNKRLAPTFRKILESARVGIKLTTLRPPGKRHVGMWEACTMQAQEKGWLDEDRQITEAGRKALEGP